MFVELLRGGKVAYTSIIKGIGGTEMTQNELYMTLVIYNEGK